MQHAVSISIDAPAELVWAVLSDVTRWHEWTASITRIELLDEGPFGVGSRARVMQPKLAPVVYTVTEFEPGRSFTWQAESVGVTALGEHGIEPGAADSVSVTLSIQITGVLAAVVSLFAAGLTRRYVSMEAEGLKRRCESGRPVPAA